MNTPTETALFEEKPDNVPAIGSLLRERRESLGYTVDAVEAELRIRYYHIEAIEEGRFDDLPGPTYVIGFVRSYARFLDLDSDEFVRRLRILYPDSRAPYAPWPPGELPPPEDERKFSRIGILVTAMGLIVLASVGWYHVSSNRLGIADLVRIVDDRIAGEAATGTPPHDPAPELPETAIADPGGPVAGASPGNGMTAALDPAADAGVAQPGETAPMAGPTALTEPEATVSGDGGTPAMVVADGAPAEIVLRANAETYIVLMAPNGAVYQARLLRKGDTYTVPSDRSDLSLDTGNIGALEIVVNGQELPPLGEAGEVRRNISLVPRALLEQGR